MNMEQWKQLEKECEECHKCELYKNDGKTVLGKGYKKASIMFIGKAPRRKRK